MLEKEMTYYEAMTHLVNKNTKFRVESAAMDFLVDAAIEYEEEQSMCDEDYDSLDNFLDEFIKEDYNTMFDIIKFVTFYGEQDAMQELIKNGRWFTYKN